MCKITGIKYDISFHEEVAYSIAHGTSLIGKRSITLMKTCGVVKAGNAVIGSLCSGVNAGFVILAFNDKGGLSSDCLFNVNEMFNGLGIPHHLSNVNNIYNEIFSCFKESENIKLPVVLIIDSSNMNIECHFECKKLPLTKLEYTRNPYQHIVVPPVNVYQKKILDLKRNNRDWQNVEIPILPQIPKDLTFDIWRNTAIQYHQLFKVFKNIRGDIVTGDSGVSAFFGFPPYDCIDMLTYFGGSIPLAIGSYLGGHKNVWAVTGDFTFIAAGHLGLIEAVSRKTPIKILILDNGQSACTGGHDIRDNTLDTLLEGYRKYVSYIKNPQDPNEIMSILTQANNDIQLNIVVAKY
ncbi:MAG: thiamine pyrophosphate-dependent enzyme [Candidatus Bathyarchaeota archaeon]|nr:thiamine pyrophosphate-dependent enzyme [Candidatus Termiticorpusculum sp.]